MHVLILTIAGKSSRYQGYKPKWSLTMPNGNIMAAESIRGVTGYDRLVIAYNSAQGFRPDAIAREVGIPNLINPADILMVDVGTTESHSETIAKTLDVIPLAHYSFTAKDCDNSFHYHCKPINEVAVGSLNEVVEFTPSNKSYVEVQGGVVTKIVEKVVISPMFCTGAYSFASPDDFLDNYHGLQYVSEVIANSDKPFGVQMVVGYYDWGTAKEYKSFKESFSTFFCDIDGVLFESAHRSFGLKAWGENQPISANIETIKHLRSRGLCFLILTTSRNEDFRQKTEKQLADAGIEYDNLIMGLPNCKRVIINDVVATRGERTCAAINIERDSETLKGHIEAL